MIAGPDLLLKCVSCDHHVIRHTLTSGNTFYATLWTDGQLEAAMLPRYLTFEYWYCEKCETFQQVSDMGEIDSKIGGKSIKAELKKQWKKAPVMDEPTWEHYLKGIKQWENLLFTNPDLETELRMLSWRRYNDEYREKLKTQNNSWRNLLSKKGKEEQLIKVSHIPQMMDNTNTVATWLYEGQPDQGMDKADLLRWLGRFELANQLLKTIPSLDDFDHKGHHGRYKLLLNLSESRDRSLGIVAES